MKFIKTAFQILLLYGIFLTGSWLTTVLHLPLPGSIVGLLLLWVALLLKILRLEWVESGGHVFLSYLPLFFVPAMVGVMDYGSLFVGKGFLLIPITIISTFFTMWVSGLTSQFIVRQAEKRKGQIL